MTTNDADSPPLLDVREESRFVVGHAPGAANIPLEELPRRAHELPPKGSALRLFDDDASRWNTAAAWLRRRGYTVEEASLWPPDPAGTGASRSRLWRPNPLLVEALVILEPACREGRSDADGPPTRRALDLACGSGRDAVYLALHGWAVDAIDVLPDALERAADLARRCGVAVNTMRQDLRRESALPEGSYTLVVVMRFFHRPLLPTVRRSVAPGGFALCEAFHESDAGPAGTRGPTGARGPTGGARRLRSSHLARDGELATAFEGFDVLLARDGVQRDGRRFSQLLARRRPHQSPAPALPD